MISSADWMCSRPVRPASIAVVRQHRPDQPGLLGHGDCEAGRRAERGHLAVEGKVAVVRHKLGSYHVACRSVRGGVASYVHARHHC
jgi:hypothetical protein